MAKTTRPLVGISRCLLGEPVRYDGAHKHDRTLIEAFTPFVEWVPICPEVEAGFGIPREPMHLVSDTGSAQAPRLLTIQTQQDRTEALVRAAARRLREFRRLNLSGYIFKSGSPSCGLADVPISDRRSRPRRPGAGLFAAAVTRALPLIPVADERQLRSLRHRRAFLERLIGHREWLDFKASRPARTGLLTFHARQRDRLFARDPSRAHRLDALVSRAIGRSGSKATALLKTYERLFCETLAIPLTNRVGRPHLKKPPVRQRRQNR